MLCTLRRGDSIEVDQASSLPDESLRHDSSPRARLARKQSLGLKALRVLTPTPGWCSASQCCVGRARDSGGMKSVGEDTCAREKMVVLFLHRFLSLETQNSRKRFLKNRPILLYEAPEDKCNDPCSAVNLSLITSRICFSFFRSEEIRMHYPNSEGTIMVDLALCFQKEEGTDAFSMSEVLFCILL